MIRVGNLTSKQAAEKVRMRQKDTLERFWIRDWQFTLALHENTGDPS